MATDTGTWTGRTGKGREGRGEKGRREGRQVEGGWGSVDMQRVGGEEGEKCRNRSVIDGGDGRKKNWK